MEAEVLIEEDRSKSETLAANERVKAISGAFMTLGTGLLAASVARVYVNGGADGPVVLWIICVILLIWSGLKLLSLLDGEA